MPLIHTIPLYLAAPADITPNSDGLPGVAATQKIVGALLTLGLIAAVAGIAIGSIVWAVGSHSSNPHAASKGKTGVLASVGAAILIGAANALVAFFWNVGVGF